MKQILQDLRGGETQLANVPAPLIRPKHLRISTAVSLVSAGTERMLVDFARGSLLSKACQQPERVREVLQKMQMDGVATTYDAVRTKLGQPNTLGYCNVGRVLEVGVGAGGFNPGDRVVSNGKHAEIVVVPWTLAARIPDGVDDESAAFTVLAAIALQGMRLAAPSLGECFVVTGLGLIGLITVQMLRANGCRVLGIDTMPERLVLARQFGAETVDLSTGEDPLAKAAEFSRGRGVDGVLLTLSANSSEPVSQAARMCRKRGRIVLIGVTGLELNRADFYEKEISLQVSCSYGPGRYDPSYEEGGHDYPFGFVRWTEQRNFEAVLDMMASGALEFAPLITHRFEIEQAPAAYDVLVSGEKSLGILLRYSSANAAAPATRIELERRRVAPTKASTGFVGAGNYGGRVLISAFKDAGAHLNAIASASGVSAAHHGRKFGFLSASSDAGSVIVDPSVDTVCIATRHDSHAGFVRSALAAGKHVFVEKPLCLKLEEVDAIARDLAAAPNAPLLMVGFNRRFAPTTVKAAQLLATMGVPKSMIMTVNAGAIPEDHWTQDPLVGGGRIVGEACHFIDLLRHLAAASIAEFEVAKMQSAKGMLIADTVVISLRFVDGSLGVINYFSNGNKTYPKERLEVFCGGRILVLNNFRKLTGYGWPGFNSMTTWRQDKGQIACVRAFVEAIKAGKPSPISPEEIFEVSRIAIEAAERI